MDPAIINKTGRAVVAISLIVFSVFTIAWLIMNGVPTNSLHQSAMSWSYTLLMVCMAAIGLEATVARILPLLVTPK